jgi:hypothetical protein
MPSPHKLANSEAYTEPCASAKTPEVATLEHLLAIESITHLSEYLVKNDHLEVGDREAVYTALILSVRNHALDTIKTLAP